MEIGNNTIIKSFKNNMLQKILPERHLKAKPFTHRNKAKNVTFKDKDGIFYKFLHKKICFLKKIPIMRAFYYWFINCYG